jgi:hypothetical protein
MRIREAQNLRIRIQMLFRILNTAFNGVFFVSWMEILVVARKSTRRVLSNLDRHHHLGIYFYIIFFSVADPHWFQGSDPYPAFYLNADPDP